MKPALRDLRDLKTIFFWRCVVSELLSSMFYCYVATTVTLRINETKDPRLWKDHAALLHVALTIGLSVTTMSYIFRIKHGGFINPAVTFGHFACWRIGFFKAVLYLIMQMLGGLVGNAIVYGLSEQKNLTMNGFPSISVSTLNACIIEGMLTYIVVMVTLACTDKKRNESEASGSMIYGFAVVAVHLVGMQYTGCVLNPARIFGIAIVINHWPKHVWIYWAGPITGGVLAGISYCSFFSIQRQKNDRRRVHTKTSYVIEHSKNRHFDDMNSKSFVVNGNHDNIIMNTTI